jgi:hypothetical protein
MFNTILFGYLVFLLLINNFKKNILNIYRRISRRNQAVDILPRVAKQLPPMPQLPPDTFRRWLPLLLPTDIFCQYLTESFEIFTTHATITDGYSVGDYHWKDRRNYSISKVLEGNFFLARFAVYNTVGVWFFLLSTKIATEWEITDGRIPSVKYLPTVSVPHTDGMNPSVKLFNGVVFIIHGMEQLWVHCSFHDHARY